VNSTWWQRKIIALLHDPPDKVLGIPGHEKRARELVQKALKLPEEVLEEKWKKAKEADRIASALDRIPFPSKLTVECDRVIHPLSAQEHPIALPSADQRVTLQDLQNQVVESLLEGDDKTRFLRLWRLFQEHLEQKAPSIPWALLPAETRMPDHPLMHHLRVTSAVAVLENPVTLLFSIGPVQSFIFSARKTRDLWMGSFLISYLTWHAIKVIAEELGPDHLLYPSLLGQPFGELWLSDKKIVERPGPEKLRIATIPNRFFALVPADRAEELAKKAEKELKDKWKRLADEVWKRIEVEIPELQKAKEIWQRQIDQFPQIYWAIYKWGKTPEDIARQFRELTNSERFEKWIGQFKEMGRGWGINVGSVYAACYELTERVLGARKALRDFCDRSEPAGKCSLCGERQALSDLDAQVPRDWWEREKEFWSKVAEKFVGDVDSDGSERLCAICTIKRFAPKLVFAEELGISTEFPSTDSIAEFPSTDSIAAATFVKALFERWAEAKNYIKDLLETISRQPEWRRIAFVGMGIQKLDQEAKKLDDTAQKLTKLDGEWLFAESYDPKRIQRAHGIVVSDEVTKRLREKVLSKLYEKIARPSDYYAVLFMDVDQMGKWLSGTHEKLPTFAEILHPQIRVQLEGQSNWQTVLETQRLMSPSLHAAISEALANFALNAVPFVVEELHAGRLVYAGGDDVLALLPLADVLPAARKLRALFSGEAKRFGNDILVEFGSTQWTGWLEWEGRKLFTMGNRATASIGIVVAHRLHPLRDVLRQGREAEEDAKELYERNAICVRWLKRSGEQVQMGAQFFYPDHCINDTLQVLMDFAELMRTKISRGFATDLMRESFALADLDEKAQEAELRRLLKRRSELSDDQIKDWAQKLARLAVVLDTHADRNADPFDLTRPQRGIVELGKWLTFLRFLTGGGE
jgi:CRISPR-associated protein Cmr2